MMPDPVPTDPRHGIANEEEVNQSSETLEPQDGDEEKPKEG